MKSKIVRSLVPVAVLATGLAAIAVAQAPATQPAQNAVAPAVAISPPGGAPRSFADLTARLAPAVVNVSTTQKVEIGRMRLHVIHNPGHTEGSISFQVANTPLLFTGDTLFPGGPGNATFEGGDFTTIIESVEQKLFVFPDDTIVLPGHGSNTTIGTERPHLQEWVDRGW